MTSVWVETWYLESINLMETAAFMICWFEAKSNTAPLTEAFVLPQGPTTSLCFKCASTACSVTLIVIGLSGLPNGICHTDTFSLFSACLVYACSSTGLFPGLVCKCRGCSNKLASIGSFTASCKVSRKLVAIPNKSIATTANSMHRKALITALAFIVVGQMKW